MKRFRIWDLGLGFESRRRQFFCLKQQNKPIFSTIKSALDIPITLYLPSIIKMHLFSFSAMGVIVSFNSFIPNTLFKQSNPIVFTEFTVEWYRQISKTIILTIFLQIFTPHLSNLLYYFYKITKRFYDQHFTCDRSKTRQLTQQDYVNI